MKPDNLEERVNQHGNWRPQFQERMKREWQYFLPYRISPEEAEGYRKEGWSVMGCYDYINADFTAFKR